MTKNTIFDDIFHTMVQKMPQLLISVVNEIFHTDYTEDEVLTQLRVRMVEYDFAIALEQIKKIGRIYEMDFPHSCVLYLRCSKVTPDRLEVKVNLPNGDFFIYETKVIKVQNYTRKANLIFERG